MEWIDLVQSTTGNILTFGRYLLVLHDTLLINVYHTVGQSTEKISINICIIQIQILRNPNSGVRVSIYSLLLAIQEYYCSPPPYLVC